MELYQHRDISSLICSIARKCMMFYQVKHNSEVFFSVLTKHRTACAGLLQPSDETAFFFVLVVSQPAFLLSRAHSSTTAKCAEESSHKTAEALTAVKVLGTHALCIY